MERKIKTLSFTTNRALCLGFCFCLLSVSLATAQSDQQTSADCTFEDGKQLSVRYQPVEAKKPPANNEAWAPGGSPLILFSQTNLDLAGTEVPVGAYSMYVVPSKDQWTLVVNRNVSAEAKYDKEQDLVRIPMQTAELSQPVNRLKVTFGRVAPKQCNMRIYYQNVGAFGIEMKEK